MGHYYPTLLVNSGRPTIQAQIAASLRHLKEAAAHISEAARAIGDADKLAAANIDQLLQAVRAGIRHLEELNSQQD